MAHFAQLDENNIVLNVVVVNNEVLLNQNNEEVEQQNIPSYFSKPKLRYSDVFRFQ